MITRKDETDETSRDISSINLPAGIFIWHKNISSQTRNSTPMLNTFRFAEKHHFSGLTSL